MAALFWLALKNQWSAQMRRPIEFVSSLIALILNNSFYLYGIYLLAILSHEGDSFAKKEYLMSTGMVLTSWGLLNVLAGGLFELCTLIETGGLETFLAKPRPPLLLVAISKSNVVSIGEIIQGISTLILVAVIYGFAPSLRALASSVILAFAFAGIVILIGSLSFISSRGGQLSYVLLNVILTLSLFPISRALQGREKWILYLSPLLLTATLPRLAALGGDIMTFVIFIFATSGLFAASIMVFKVGLESYKATNYIVLNE